MAAATGAVPVEGTKAEAQGNGQRLRTVLATAVSHSVRTKCLVILGERVASPAEIAREIWIDVGTVAYHVRELEKWELVEKVEERQVRGAVEHLFRAVAIAELSEEEEASMLPADRQRFAESILSFFAADAVDSLDKELLVARTDHHLTRAVIDLDEQGWKEATEAYMELFDRINEIEEGASERIEASDAKTGKPLRVMSFQGVFEVPPQKAAT